MSYPWICLHQVMILKITGPLQKADVPKVKAEMLAKRGSDSFIFLDFSSLQQSLSASEVRLWADLAGVLWKEHALAVKMLLDPATLKKKDAGAVETVAQLTELLKHETTAAGADRVAMTAAAPQFKEILQGATLQSAGRREGKTGFILPPIRKNGLLLMLLPSMNKNFKTYIKKELTWGQASPMSELQNQTEIDAFECLGVAHFQFNQDPGFLLLGLKKQALVEMVSLIMKKSCKWEDPGVQEWLAELLNSSLGSLKVALRNQGHVFQFGLPTVMAGAALSEFKKTKASVSCEQIEGTGPFGQCSLLIG